jgi:hypothetical protein
MKTVRAGPWAQDDEVDAEGKDEDRRREQHVVRGKTRFSNLAKRGTRSGICSTRGRNIYIIEFQKFYSFHNYHILGI